MSKKYDAVINKILADKSPESSDMRDIMFRMVKAEIAWTKKHGHQKPCPRCKELGITQQV